MAKTNAIVTASYKADFPRCEILCETIDRRASGYEMHYLLVDEPDVELFSQLEGPKRKILTDKQLLPWWFRRLPKSLSPKGRRLWVSPLTAPLHGWHVQQLMRIAIAFHVSEDGFLYCDSDTAFTKDFDLSDMWKEDAMRLWYQPEGARIAKSKHKEWQAHSAHALGIPSDDEVQHNYVCSFVTWSRQTMLDMCARMEEVHKRPWISVIGKSRQFSECMLYGAYVDSLLKGQGHWHDEEELCPMQWFDPAPSEAELSAFIAALGPYQVGMGIQSFIAMEPSRFRNAVIEASAKAA